MALQNNVSDVFYYCKSDNLVSMSIIEFIDFLEENNIYLFNALHGGFGEGGKLQEMLEAKRIPFNGSTSKVSELCLDKKECCLKLMFFPHKNISILNEHYLSKEHLVLISNQDDEEAEISFSKLLERCHYYYNENKKTQYLILKPRYDGCSVGVCIITNGKEFKKYCIKSNWNSEL